LNLDWECLIRAQRREEIACRELIGQYQSRLMALALVITGSPAAAADVVQETFIRALDAKLKNTTGTVQGFLGTIAYRLALKESKQAKRNVELNDLDSLDQKPNPLDDVLIDERDRLVAQAIRTLDVGHRDALILRFYGGHSFEEIAGLLKIPLGTAKSRIFYAVKSCREILREKGVLE
jgi:RNA polymerase sigma-70 factor (ECF subfamily)